MSDEREKLIEKAGDFLMAEKVRIIRLNQQEQMADFALSVLEERADEKNKEIRRIAEQTPGLYARDFGG